MSDDELEKMATEMKNAKPSDAARLRGMQAAMAAFDTEFVSDPVLETVSEAALEKNLNLSQETSAEPRLTSESTGKTRVPGFGRNAMAKVKNWVNFKPKTLMMMGSATAALLVASLYIPTDLFNNSPSHSPSVEAAEAPIADRDVAEIKAADRNVAGGETPGAGTGPDLGIESEVDMKGIDAETVQGADPASDKSVSTERPSIADPSPGDFSTDDKVSEDVSVPVETPSMDLGITTSGEDPALPSDTVVVERRILVSPARTTERAAPSIAKTETRQVIKTPARTVERAVPAVTKQVERRVEAEDGTFETVTETVVVQEASMELTTVPPTYETVTETIIVQEASSELVTIPPVYATIRETVKIGADGSTTVLKSETLSAPVSPLGDTARSRDTAGSFASDVRAETAPAAVAKTMAAADADEVIVTGARSDKASASRKARRAADAGAISPSTSSSLPSAPVGSPISRPATGLESISSSDIPATSRIVERAVPAVTKQVTRRVVKTPAATHERTVPAITKDVTARVMTDDGTYKDVTTTFVIQPATTELITIPPTYQTVTETVVVAPAGTEYIVLHADGTTTSITSVKPKPKPKPKPVPQSGLLTAGDYDDVLNPDLYKIYLDKMLQGPLKGKDLPYVDSHNRIGIRVVDTLGKAVPMSDITVRSADRKTTFTVRTGADGMAYLYPEFDELERGARLKVSAKGSRSVRRELTRQQLNNGGEIVIDMSMDSAPVQKLDLLLTIDSTGSMADEMRYLQSELKAILARVEAANPGVDIRTGLIVYRDQGDSYVIRETPFTGDIDAFQKELSAQSAGGGGDMPEAMHTAMQAGLDMAWRDDAIKVNLLVADAPPHDRHIETTWDLGLQSRNEGIHIVPLAASGVDKTAEFLMRSMAQVTGGRFLFLTDDSGIGNPHAEPTVDCYVVTRLDGLVTRVLDGLISGERVEPGADDVIRSVGNYRAGTCAIDDTDKIPSLQNVSQKNKR